MVDGIQKIRVIYTKTSELYVETEDDINRPVMINLDGEYGGNAPMHFKNLHQHIEFFANTDQIPDAAITGPEELEEVSKEFVKEVEKLTDEDIDGDGKIGDEEKK
jgi:diacylglycerol kinase (ATP)